MFGNRIKIDKNLYRRAKEHTLRHGYPSVDDLVVHLLEKELHREAAAPESQEEIKKRLQGLGYIS